MLGSIPLRWESACAVPVSAKCQGAAFFIGHAENIQVRESTGGRSHTPNANSKLFGGRYSSLNEWPSNDVFSEHN